MSEKLPSLPPAWITCRANCVCPRCMSEDRMQRGGIAAALDHPEHPRQIGEVVIALASVDATADQITSFARACEELGRAVGSGQHIRAAYRAVARLAVIHGHVRGLDRLNRRFIRPEGRF